MEATKGIKPATPLPWSTAGTQGKGYTVWAGNTILFQAANARSGNAAAIKDAAYIVAAANNYPRLVAALKDVLSAHKFDGSPMNKARALLSELGEA